MMTDKVFDSAKTILDDYRGEVAQIMADYADGDTRYYEDVRDGLRAEGHTADVIEYLRGLAVFEQPAVRDGYFEFCEAVLCDWERQDWEESGAAAEFHDACEEAKAEAWAERRG